MSNCLELIEKLESVECSNTPNAQNTPNVTNTDDNKNSLGRKIKSEKFEYMKQFKNIESVDECVKLVSKLFDEEQDINILKNQIFGIVLILLRHENVSEDVDSKHLPLGSGTNEFQAASTWYKPQGFLIGHEKQIDTFIRENILNDVKNTQRILLETFYIIRSHLVAKEKEKQKQQNST